MNQIKSLLCAPELIAIDLDRCVYDTTIAAKKMTRLAVREGLATTSEIEEAQFRTQESGGSFDILGYLEGNGRSQEEITGLGRVFGENKEADELLYPDSPRLFRALAETGTPSFIPTKGGYVWQVSKLQSAQYDGTDLYHHPHLITDKTHKGEVIEDFQDEDGIYRVEACVGATATVLVVAKDAKIIEDKIPGFQRRQGNFGGFHIMREAKLLESQKGEIPPDVVQSNNLDLAIAYIYRQAEAASR